MMKFRHTVQSLAIFAFVLIAASAAQAQATRTWVSGVGNDADPCSRTAPCKTFAGAIIKTAVNGEINVIDNGPYGAVTINKSITIDGTGSFASILATNVTGISVNLTTTVALDPVSAVRIRGVAINGTGTCGAGCGTRTGIRGIHVSTANTRAVTLHVEDVVIDGFVNEGILFSPPGGDLVVRNSSVRNNGTKGIMVDSKDTNVVHASIFNTDITRNQEGLRAETTARVSAKDCNISNNSLNGVSVATSVGSTAEINLNNCLISHNRQFGVAVDQVGSVARISYCEIVSNTGIAGAEGVHATNGGQILTNQHNTIRGNTSDGLTTGVITEN